MARICISNDPFGRIIVSFPYDLLLVVKVKTIDGRKCHPVVKYWSFQHPLPSPSMGEGKSRGGKVKIGDVLEV